MDACKFCGVVPKEGGRMCHPAWLALRPTPSARWLPPVGYRWPGKCEGQESSARLGTFDVLPTENELSELVAAARAYNAGQPDLAVRDVAGEYAESGCATPHLQAEIARLTKERDNLDARVTRFAMALNDAVAASERNYLSACDAHRKLCRKLCEETERYRVNEERWQAFATQVAAEITRFRALVPCYVCSLVGVDQTINGFEVHERCMIADVRFETWTDGDVLACPVTASPIPYPGLEARRRTVLRGKPE